MSFVIPVYNAEKYLPDCLKSIVNQSLKDIEIICINDCSTDRSLEIIENFKKTDDRIRVYSNETNSGAAFSRNSGLTYSNGEYTAFVDADDTIDLNFAEKLYVLAKSTNSDLILFDSMEYNLTGTNKRRKHLNGSKYDKNPFIDIFNNNYEKELVFNRFLVVWSKIYKTDFIKKITFPDFPIFEDISFHVESMLAAKKISYLPEFLYNYNKINVNSEQNSKVKTRNSLVIIDVFILIKKILLKYGVFNKLKINFLRFVLTESISVLGKIDDEFKPFLFTKIKNFINTLDVDVGDLNHLPMDNYQFYVYIINSDSYFDYININQQTKTDINHLIELLKKRNKQLINLENKYNALLIENEILLKIQENYVANYLSNDEIYIKLKKLNLFDEEYYSNYKGYFGNIHPYLHYIYAGYKYGFNPSLLFNSNFYMANNPDLNYDDTNPLIHFISKGLLEGNIKIRSDVYQPNSINRLNIDKEISKFNQSGISTEERKPNLIVSLTSYPKRINIVKYVIYSIFNQQLKPDKIVLWLAEDQFVNGEDDIPKDLLKLKQFGLEIKWCSDLKSYKKLIPSLLEYPNDLIVTIDDDIYFDDLWLKKLFDYHLLYPNCIICHRARKITFNDDKTISSYNDWKLIKGESKPSFLNFFTGAGGVLYPPNSLDSYIYDEKLFFNLTPTGDDVWFWAMAVKKGTKIVVVKDNVSDLTYVSPEMEMGLFDEGKDTLWAINSKGLNDVHIDNVLSKFPDVKNILISAYFNK